MRPESLHAEPNALAPDYSRFRVTERVLLSGHSHQAWPDVAFEGQQRAWLDAAEYVDEKWARAFERADRVRRGYARLLGEPDADVALAESTHELLVRLLSALPLRERPRVVTTAGEFHSARRQLARLEEAGLEVVRVDVDPIDSLAERVAAEVDDRTAAALVSSVLFLDARVVPGLATTAAACRRVGATFVVDAYHHLNALPFSVRALDLEDAFVVGGGYKYCQLGEGNAFMRLPKACALRPVVTGWFAEFGGVIKAGRERELGGEAGTASSRAGAADAVRHARGAAFGDAGDADAPRVPYAAGPTRFAGATYDPTSNYRGAAVFDFFQEKGLTPELLREVSQHQVGLLIEGFDGLDVDPAVARRAVEVPLDRLGGFLALRAPRAGELAAALRARGVFVDYRGEVLRMGPAPYLSDAQLRDGVAALGEAVREVGGGT